MPMFCTGRGFWGGGGTQLLRTDTLTSGTTTAFSVPVNAQYAWVKLWGAGGGNASGGGNGGKGGYVEALVPISALLTYYYSIGTAGANESSGISAGGSPAGGDGRGTGRAAGGGRTEFYHTSQTQANMLALAAGGGGGGTVTGGAGGADEGESVGGTGGTQSAGGSQAGAALQGGDAASGTTRSGGGDGYYGGGAGNGGGGGSNHIDAACTHTSSVRGNNTGDVDYPGGFIGEAGNRGHMIVEWWSGDPFAAGLKT